MKKILISLMAIALVVGLVGAGTIAYFSDTESSTGNTFTAGTLVLSVTGSETGSAGWVSPTNWAPGETEDGNVVLANTGTIEAAMQLQIDNITVAGGTPNIAPDVIISAMTYDAVSILADVQTKLEDSGDLRLSELANLTNYVLETGTFGTQDIGTLAMNFTYDSAATAQGASAGMAINFSLTQTGS